MGKAVLILVIGSIIVVSLFSLNIIGGVNRSTDTAVDQFNRKQARLIANSLVNIGLSKLSDNPEWRQDSPYPDTLLGGSGSYRVVDTVFEGTDVVKIITKGIFHGNIVYNTAFVDKPEPTTTILPFLSYAVLAGYEPAFTGTTINILNGTTNPLQNANVHSNNKLTWTGNNVFVEGFGTYVNSVSHPEIVTCQPNYNPENLAVLRQVSEIVDMSNLANIDFAKLKSQAEVRTDWVGKTLSSINIQLGTAASPKIIYIPGSVTFSNVTVTGYGTIVSEKDIMIGGEFRQTNLDPNFSETLIIAQGKLMSHSSSTIYNVDATQLGISEVNINVSGSVTCKGSFLNPGSRGIKLTSKPITLYYKPLHWSVSGQVFGGGVAASDPTRLEVKYWFE